MPELVEQLGRCLEERDKAVELFMSGDGRDLGAGSCQRCTADLTLKDGGTVFKTYVEDDDVFETGFLSSEIGDNAVWIILALLLLGVAIASKAQQQTANE